MKREPSLRKIDCPKYADCLGVAAHTDGPFDCRGCEKFSKWPYGKDFESILKIKPSVMEKIETEVPTKEVEKMSAKKVCSACHQSKSLEEFAMNRSTPDGHEYKCRGCLADYRASRKKPRRDSENSGNGRRKPGRRKFVSRASHSLKIAVPPVPIQGIYLDPAVIKAIQKSAAKQVLKDISEFLAERYS